MSIGFIGIAAKMSFKEEFEEQEGKETFKETLLLMSGADRI